MTSVDPQAISSETHIIERAKDVAMLRMFTAFLAVLMAVSFARAQPIVLTCFVAEDDPMSWWVEGQHPGTFELDMKAKTFTSQENPNYAAPVIFDDWNVVVILAVLPISNTEADSGFWILNKTNWNWTAIWTKHSTEFMLPKEQPFKIGGYCEASIPE